MKIEHIAMYVNDLERAKDFFIKYFNAAADAGYLNKTTGFRSYFLTFEDGARLEIMNQSDLVDNEKALPRTGYYQAAHGSSGFHQDNHSPDCRPAGNSARLPTR